ncbi:MAG: methylisocitrate lyase [Alphaproteobacteria bacterium]
MSWLTGGGDQRPPGERLGELIARPGILRAPGVYNALSGLVAREAGFEALYLSGGALTASMGLPDLGVLTLDELARATRSIFRATDLPLIVDADTGYGEALNVMRTVRELEAAGAAAIQIEDQLMPKKCGHLDDKRLVSAEDMATKVAAACRARTAARIVARTDAAAESLEAAIDRLRLYARAGADVVFADALTGEEDFRRVAEAVDAPLLANMTEFGRTPQIDAGRFAELGVRIVIWPVSALRVAARAMTEFYADLYDRGSAEAWLERMQSRDELYETIGYDDYVALDNDIASRARRRRKGRH